MLPSELQKKKEELQTVFQIFTAAGRYGILENLSTYLSALDSWPVFPGATYLNTSIRGGGSLAKFLRGPMKTDN